MTDDDLDVRLRSALHDAVDDWRPDPPGAAFARRRNRRFEVLAIAAALLLVVGVAAGITLTRLSMTSVSMPALKRNGSTVAGAVGSALPSGTAQGADCGHASVTRGDTFTCVGIVAAGSQGTWPSPAFAPSNTPGSSETANGATSTGAATGAPGSALPTRNTSNSFPVSVGQTVTVGTPAASPGEAWFWLTPSPASADGLVTVSTQNGKESPTEVGHGAASAVFRAVSPGTTVVTALEIGTCGQRRCAVPHATWTVNVIIEHS